MNSTARFIQPSPARSVLALALLGVALNLLPGASRPARGGFTGTIPTIVFGPLGMVPGQTARLAYNNTFGEEPVAVELALFEVFTGALVAGGKGTVAEPGKGVILEYTIPPTPTPDGDGVARTELLGVARVAKLGPDGEPLPRGLTDGAASLEVYDGLTGETRSSVDPKDSGRGTVAPEAAEPLVDLLGFGPVGLIDGQLARLLVTNPSDGPLTVDLLFVDAETGVAVSGGKSVSVEPGTGVTLDLDAGTLGLALGERAEVLGIGVVSAVDPKDDGVASLQVIDGLTGETRSSVDPKDDFFGEFGRATLGVR